MPKKKSETMTAEEKLAILEEKLAKFEAMISEEKKPAKKEPAKKEPKEVVYQKIKFINVASPGKNLQFNYNNKYYELPDGCEVSLKKEIVDHLNNVKERQSTNINIDTGVKEYSYKNRFICQVLSEETKVE